MLEAVEVMKAGTKIRIGYRAKIKTQTFLLPNLNSQDRSAKGDSLS